MGLLGKPPVKKFKKITNKFFLKLVHFSADKFVFRKRRIRISKKMYGETIQKSVISHLA